MEQRIIGFDLARAYAIFGMFIVNFNIVFGSHTDMSLLGQFLSLFSGNSSTVFVILAGMGIALMTNRTEYTSLEKIKLRTTVIKRACFLFIIGLLLSIWWPADILHFYGGYMLIAALLLSLDKKYYLVSAIIAIVVFHVLLFFVPYETGWDFETLEYKDLYTLNGFVRNYFYNGWNSIFPWVAYFLLGMFLGRLNWRYPKTQRKMFFIGLALYSTIGILQFTSQRISISDELKFFINADYLPPFLPFILSTSGFGLMLISGFMFLGNKFGDKQCVKDFASTGQMTLTHYISHVTIGILSFAFLTDKNYTGYITEQVPTRPFVILLFSVAYFVISFYLSKVWVRHYKNGPLETLMRKISG